MTTIEQAINLTRNTIPAQRLMEKITNDLKKHDTKKDIHVHDRTTITKTTIHHHHNPGTHLPTRQAQTQQYNELLQGKINDKNTHHKAVRYAELVMQETTYVELELKEHTITRAKLKILCALPEHTSIMANHWIGQTLESSQNAFKKQVSIFEKRMKNYGTGNVLIEQANTAKNAKCTNTTSNITYA